MHVELVERTEAYGAAYRVWFEHQGISWYRYLNNNEDDIKEFIEMVIEETGMRFGEIDG